MNLQAMHGQEKEALLSQMEHVTSLKPAVEGQFKKKMQDLIAQNTARESEIESLKLAKE